jgi:glycosyltransferase involved in cell wall biosynthesis
MKITHFFILNDEDKNPFSGAENHLWELLKGSAKVNGDTELLVAIRQTGKVIEHRLKDLRRNGVKVSLIDRKKRKFSSNSYFRMIQECLIYHKEFRKRKDRVLHLHLNSNIIPTTAILAGHPNIFFTFHNDEPYFKKTLSKFLLEKMFFWFRHTIAITGHVKNYLVAEVGLPNNKISVIRYGINPPPLNNIEELNLPQLPGKIKLCFVGRLTEQKNLFFFFECLKELSDVSLVLFGDGADRQELVDLSIELGIAERVYFYGYLHAASSYIKTFDFLCLPSKWEGLGLVLIEAMYQKVSIIGADAGAIPEVLDYGRLGDIISYSDKEKAVMEMKRIFEDFMNGIDKRDSALEFARINYTVERMVLETIDMYEKHCNFI